MIVSRPRFWFKNCDSCLQPGLANLGTLLVGSDHYRNNCQCRIYSTTAYPSCQSWDTCTTTLHACCTRSHMQEFIFILAYPWFSRVGWRRPNGAWRDGASLFYGVEDGVRVCQSLRTIKRSGSVARQRSCPCGNIYQGKPSIDLSAYPSMLLLNSNWIEKMFWK